MTTFIYPQLWLSEAVSGFVFTICALWIWVFMQREHEIINSRFKGRLFAGLALVGITIASMFSGMIISNLANGWGPALNNEGGHGWGNPALSMSLAFAQPFHVFQEPLVLVLGIFYVIFMFLGGAVGLVLFILGVWIYNSTSTDKTKIIYLTKLFQMDTTHPARVFSKDAIASMVVGFTFVGSTLMGTDLPDAFPSQVLFRFTSVIATAFASMLVAMMYGQRMILVINPVVWLMAFVLKFASSIIRNQKISAQNWLSELASPIATIGAGLVTGLLIFGMINLPHKVEFDGKVS